VGHHPSVARRPLGMHPFLQERLHAVLPPGVRIHKHKEPDETNLAAPTVKLSVALGILALRYEPMDPTAVTDQRSAFEYVVGRPRRGKAVRGDRLDGWLRPLARARGLHAA